VGGDSSSIALRHTQNTNDFNSAPIDGNGSDYVWAEAENGEQYQFTETGRPVFMMLPTSGH
jgi:hypothetical protein